MTIISNNTFLLKTLTFYQVVSNVAMLQVLINLNCNIILKLWSVQ